MISFFWRPSIFAIVVPRSLTLNDPSGNLGLPPFERLLEEQENVGGPAETAALLVNLFDHGLREGNSDRYLVVDFIGQGCPNVTLQSVISYVNVTKVMMCFA